MDFTYNPDEKFIIANPIGVKYSVLIKTNTRDKVFEITRLLRQGEHMLDVVLEDKRLSKALFKIPHGEPFDWMLDRVKHI